MKQGVILAGGLGTRLKPFTDDNPKPMIEIEGAPFLHYLIMQMKQFGIFDILILLGYKAEKIKDYFGDGSGMGVNISYHTTPVEYGTAARIREAACDIEDEFLLLYCDNFCPIDYKKAYEQFKRSGVMLQITAYKNQDGYTRNNLLIEDEKVQIYDKQRQTEGLSGVDIGYIFAKKKVLEYVDSCDDDSNFEALVYPKLIEESIMGCYLTEHRYYSIGSWERIELTRQFFKNRKIVFLDRDGTINVRPPKACYVEKPDQFIWLDNAKEAIKLLKEKGYEIYLISNQPGIARGLMTEEDLKAINNKMLRDLKKIGTSIDGIYYCPHGWDDGCDCRKPKPGMLYKAQKDHSINLTESYLIGDDERDIEAGMSANLKATFLVDDNYTIWDVAQELN